MGKIIPLNKSKETNLLNHDISRESSWKINSRIKWDNFSYDFTIIWTITAFILIIIYCFGFIPIAIIPFISLLTTPFIPIVTLRIIILRYIFNKNTN